MMMGEAVRFQKKETRFPAPRDAMLDLEMGETLYCQKKKTGLAVLFASKLALPLAVTRWAWALQWASQAHPRDAAGGSQPLSKKGTLDGCRNIFGIRATYTIRCHLPCGAPPTW